MPIQNKKFHWTDGFYAENKQPLASAREIRKNVPKFGFGRSNRSKLAPPKILVLRVIYEVCIIVDRPKILFLNSTSNHLAVHQCSGRPLVISLLEWFSGCWLCQGALFSFHLDANPIGTQTKRLVYCIIYRFNRWRRIILAVVTKPWGRSHNIIFQGSIFRKTEEVNSVVAENRPYFFNEFLHTPRKQ